MSSLSNKSTPLESHPSIRSIGWLHGVNNTIILTPVFHGYGHPVKVTIPAGEFALIRQSKDLMMAKAMAALA